MKAMTKAAVWIGAMAVLTASGYFAVTGNLIGIAVVAAALVSTVLWAESN